MEKMRMESIDMTQRNIDKIEAIFPNCITEAIDEEHSTPNHKVYKKAVNFELLRQMLSDEVLEGDEAYEFTWVGKKAAIVEANKPIRKTLRPCPEESVDWDYTENLYIEGDNLEVLKLLQESYLGKVKMIYIDPPYNTGKDSFVYPDNFTMRRDEYEEGIGLRDESERILFRENGEGNPRFHSDWCSMLYERLLLARNLLSNEGVIFISIDDGEADNLRKICDEVFGASNFVADLTVVNNLKGRNDKKYIARANERIIMYVASQDFSEHGLSLGEDVLKEYSQTDKGGRYRLLELRKRGGPDTRKDRPNMFYPFYVHEETGEVSLEQSGYYSIEAFPVKSNGVDGRWRWGKETAEKNIRYLYGKKVGNKYNIYEKDYLESGEGARRVRPKSVLGGSAYSTDVATKEYRALMGNVDFTNPKPIALLTDLIIYATNPEEDAIIMDFFSGSATTAHAVFAANALDGGNRKFIMVQLQEKCSEDSAAFHERYDTICKIGEERIRRAGAKVKEDSGLLAKNADLGFRVFRCDEGNMNDVYYSAGEYNQDMLSMLESNIKPDRTDLDLLFGCLLEWGLPLSMPYTSEKIEGCTVHTYNEGDLIACFDENVPDSVIKEIAKRQPLRAVFRDSSFASSPAKINVGEIFKMLAPDTRVRVI